MLIFLSNPDSSQNFKSGLKNQKKSCFIVEKMKIIPAPELDIYTQILTKKAFYWQKIYDLRHSDFIIISVYAIILKKR